MLTLAIAAAALVYALWRGLRELHDHIEDARRAHESRCQNFCPTKEEKNHEPTR